MGKKKAPSHIKSNPQFKQQVQRDRKKYHRPVKKKPEMNDEY